MCLSQFKDSSLDQTNPQTAFCDGKLKLQHPDTFDNVQCDVVEPRCCCPAAASGDQLLC